MLITYTVKIYCIFGESDNYIYGYIFIKFMASHLNYIYGWFLLHILWLIVDWYIDGCYYIYGWYST